MDVHQESERLRVFKLGPLGPIANNGYVVVDKASNESAIVDAVPEIERVLEFAEGTTVRLVLFTHSHHDHIDSFDQLKGLVDAPFHMHPEEPWADQSKIDVHLTGGETIRLGETTFQVLHTPGHTPGALCYYDPPFCFVGDTLFPGGPGHSTSAENLETMIGSITTSLHALPEETTIFPGHGDDTTIGASKAEYEEFAGRTHAPDLHGDVLWARD